MKYFKRKLGIFLIGIITLFFFSGCTPSEFIFSYEYHRDRVVAVELINYEDPNVGEKPFRLLFSKVEDDCVFDFSCCTVIETLPEEQIEPFLFECSGTYYDSTTKLNAPQGQGIRIVLANGSFMVLSWTKYEGETVDYVCGYDKDGNPLNTASSVGNSFMLTAANNFNTKIEAK